MIFLSFEGEKGSWFTLIYHFIIGSFINNWKFLYHIYSQYFKCGIIQESNVIFIHLWRDFFFFFIYAVLLLYWVRDQKSIDNLVRRKHNISRNFSQDKIVIRTNGVTKLINRLRSKYIGTLWIIEVPKFKIGFRTLGTCLSFRNVVYITV